MTYRDFAGATIVFDRHGRRGLLIFDEERGNPTIDDCAGWVSYQVFDSRQPYERLSVRTMWSHADEVLGPVHTAYRGSNVPASYKGLAADLDLIMSRLSSAGLAR